MNSRYKLLIKDTGIFAIGSLGSKAILFFLVPLYTNLLSTAEYGTADLITTFVTLIVPFTSLSIQRGVLRFGMKSGEKEEDVIANAFIVLLFSVVLTLCLIPALSLYRPISSWKYYLVLLVILSNFDEVGRTYLKVKNKNKAFSLVGVFQTAVLASMNVVLIAVLKTGIKGYLLSNIVALAACIVLTTAMSGICGDVLKGKVEIRLMRGMIIYSLPLIFSGISWWVMHSSDKVMIEWFVGASSLGLYTVATKIPSLINVITAVFGQAWTISSIRESETTKDYSFYSSTFNYHCFVLFGAGIAIISVVHPMMNVYVGEAFRESWVYTPFLLIAAIYYAIFTFCGSLYAALQRSVNDMWTSILAAVMNVIVNYVFILKFGVWGAVIGTVSSFLVFSIVRVIDIKRYITFDIDVRKFTINTLTILGQAISVTMDYHPTMISGIAFVLYIAINIETFQSLARAIKKRSWNNEKK